MREIRFTPKFEIGAAVAFKAYLSDLSAQVRNTNAAGFHLTVGNLPSPRAYIVGAINYRLPEGGAGGIDYLLSPGLERSSYTPEVALIPYEDAVTALSLAIAERRRQQCQNREREDAELAAKRELSK